MFILKNLSFMLPLFTRKLLFLSGGNIICISEACMCVCVCVVAYWQKLKFLLSAKKWFTA